MTINAHSLLDELNRYKEKGELVFITLSGENDPEHTWAYTIKGIISNNYGEIWLKADRTVYGTFIDQKDCLINVSKIVILHPRKE